MARKLNWVGFGQTLEDVGRRIDQHALIPVEVTRDKAQVILKSQLCVGDLGRINLRIEPAAVMLSAGMQRARGLGDLVGARVGHCGWKRWREAAIVIVGQSVGYTTDTW